MYYFVEKDKVLAIIEEIDGKYYFTISDEVYISQSRKELLLSMKMDFQKDDFDFQEYKKYFLNDFRFIEKD